MSAPHVDPEHAHRYQYLWNMGGANGGVILVNETRPRPVTSYGMHAREMYEVAWWPQKMVRRWRAARHTRRYL